MKTQFHSTRKCFLAISGIIVILLLNWLSPVGPSPVSAQSEATYRVPGSSGTIESFKGLCYGPHRDNEDPDFGIQPTTPEMEEDLQFIRHLTTKIRTYGVTDNLEQIPILCEQVGLECYPGAWLSKDECENRRQIDSLIKIANLGLSTTKGLIVGNEVLLRADLSEERLIAYIEKVKEATDDLPVATAETWFHWLHSEPLAEAVDIMFVHIYPYWDGVSIEESADYILEKWNELKAKYPDKHMVIGETGWPSEGEIRGEAVPSPENQKIYISDFVAMADENDIDYFYFEIFDENWKGKFEGEAGIHWGMYNADGSIKPALVDCVPVEGLNTISRPPRVVEAEEGYFPMYIYKDGCDTTRNFFSSGWMGELATILNDTFSNPTDIIDELSTDNPYSGETCIRISYTPSPGHWGGIYWQFPVNNWGHYPGYDFSNALNALEEHAQIRLSFWARGENGGEKAEFKTGGINAANLEYHDSFGPIPVSPGPVTLSQEWQQFTVDLAGRDLSMIIGGFVWATSYLQNPGGATIYLDEIVLEVDNDGDAFFSLQDCDDDNSAIYPGSEEIANNGVDEDCDGEDLISGTDLPMDSLQARVFPNPAGSHIYFSHSFHEGLNVELVDVNGASVFRRRGTAKGELCEADLSDVPSGVYWIKFSDPRGNILAVRRVVRK
ncbi:MAG: T9SS type A sorting domain-containing protein [Phaeodactylibacter sp.]|nr:T9SS type A sorting domain-containing protein [Phaeodactylibacter sp.]MCB9296992.1 T9SS type A sorting domain-containing protein [Lewinellaceae bacterium]